MVVYTTGPSGMPNLTKSPGGYSFLTDQGQPGSYGGPSYALSGGSIVAQNPPPWVPQHLTGQQYAELQGDLPGQANEYYAPQLISGQRYAELQGDMPGQANEYYAPFTIPPGSYGLVPTPRGPALVGPGGSIYLVDFSAAPSGGPSLYSITPLRFSPGRVGVFNPYRPATGLGNDFNASEIISNFEQALGVLPATIGEEIRGVIQKHEVLAPWEAYASINVGAEKVAGAAVGLAATTVLLPEALPEALGVTPARLALGATISAGLSEAESYVVTGKPASEGTLIEAGYIGEAFVPASAAAIYGVGQIPRYGVPIVSSIFGRAAINAGVGAGGGYILGGGSVQAAEEGAALGAIFSFGLDIGGRAINATRASIPERFPGSVERMTEVAPTVGKMGELEANFVSTPQEKLGGDIFRIHAGVTENPQPVEVYESEYAGKEVPTGHSTLAPGSFKLGKGGTTLLEGGEATVGVNREPLFYSAPGMASTEPYTGPVLSLEDYYNAVKTQVLGPGSRGIITPPGEPGEVLTYGGYIGVGEGYSGEAPRLSMGGKATVLATQSTFIEPEVSLEASGQSGLAPEDVATRGTGLPRERQVVTTTSYEREGEQLPGTLYRSAGKVGAFQVKEPYSGFGSETINRIPLVRDLAARYTNVDLYKGTFLPVPDAGEKGAVEPDTAIRESEAAVSIPSESISSGAALGALGSLASTRSSPSIVSEVSTPSEPAMASEPSMVSAPSAASVSSVPSFPSVPSVSSAPSLPSIPSATSVPSRPSVPSVPSNPDIPSYPSVPSVPSVPSAPSVPSMPSVPYYPLTPSTPSIPSYPRAPPYPPSVPFFIVSGPSKRLKRKEKHKFEFGRLEYPVAENLLNPLPPRAKLPATFEGDYKMSKGVLKGFSVRRRRRKDEFG
jgi:hypothetical protein